MRKRLQKKWWIEIRSKGNQARPNVLLKEAQDPNDGFVIYGEPKTWWEQKLKEPKAQLILAQMKDQRVFCTMTNDHIQITANTLPAYKVEQWQHLLNEAPPTPKDWKDSQTGRVIPAKKQNALAFQSGAPFTISPLRATKRVLKHRNAVKAPKIPVSHPP